MIDAHARLGRALLARGGDRCRPGPSSERPWASLTFEGARHILSFTLPAADAARFVAGIEEMEFAIPRHLVADLAILSHIAHGEGDRCVTIEALTLVDR